MVNEKLNDFGINQSEENYSNVLLKNTKEGFTYTNTVALDNPKKTSVTIDDTRELNIIIHGLKEDDTGAVEEELFDTMKIEQYPGTSIDRLGAKSPDKVQPIRVTMESIKVKKKFMSSLWMLKKGPEKFRLISITEDFTQEERQEIK